MIGRRSRAGPAGAGPEARRRDPRSPAASTTGSSSSIDLFDGRGPDAVIDAVGMEAARQPACTALAQSAVGKLPGPVAGKVTDVSRPRPPQRAPAGGRGVRRRWDGLRRRRLRRRRSTPMPMMEMFDRRHLNLRMGQAHVQALGRRPPAARARATTDPLGSAAT